MFACVKTLQMLTLFSPGGGKNAPPGTKIKISSWKWASNVTKLLDFIHFDLTNPMVPNLAHVFFRGGSQGPFCEELTRVKIAFLSNLDFFTQTLNSSDALLSAFYATKSVIKCLYIYWRFNNITYSVMGSPKTENPGQEHSVRARAE